MSADQYCCYFAPDDPFIRDYMTAGLTCAIARSIEAMLAIIARARVVVTADSLASHVAQLSAKVHVALMSHDVPEHTIHPAAGSVVVYEPLECCPCAYANRTQGSRCPSGHETCGVFRSGDYSEAARHAIQRHVSR
jgi:ADP-heptose:LPS heptosyltransferase